MTAPDVPALRNALRAAALAACLLALATVAAWIDPVVGAPLDESPGEGAVLFAGRCAGCHSLDPPEDLLAVAQSRGPGLHDAGRRLDPGWVASWLVDPRPIRPAGWHPHDRTVATAEGDRVDLARLPRHPRLTASEAEAVATLLARERTPVLPYPAAEANPAIRAPVHFTKILPCGGCHRVGDTGGLSAPDLTRASERLRGEWVRSFTWDPGGWGHPLMPTTRLRADQLLALTDYLMEERPAQSAPHQSPDLPEWSGEPVLPSAPAPAGHERAARLYQLLCSACHGVRGDGRGLNAPHLFLSPRDHTSYVEMSRLTDERIFDAIRLGGSAVGKSSLMPGWGSVLDDDDVWALVAYLRELSGTS